MILGAILSAALAVTALGFEDGTSAGFHSTGNARVRVVAGGHGSDHALELCDRDADWNSIELDLTGFAPAGSPCAFAAYVRQDTSDLASFDLSLKDDPDDGEARYPTVARCKARRGEWTLLKGTFPIGTGGTLPFVCRTDSTDAFRIDDVTVDCAAAYREDEPETSIPRLKDAFAVRGMTCGASVGDAVLGERTGARKRLLARHFHSLSPENQLKASFLLDRGASAADLARYGENAALDFSAPRPWFEFARANGMRVSAQALVWFMLTPEWWFHVDYDTEKPLASRPLMLKRLEGYIRGVLGWCETNYPGLVRSWVVVNESVDGDATPRLHDDLFLRTIGEDYVERAFEFANRYRPRTDCIFLCNDSNLEGYPAKRDFLLDYLKRHRIIERKWVDGIGVQGHLKMDWPDASDIRSCCAAIRAAGLSVEVTELDIALSASQIKAFGSPEEAFRRQAARYEEAVRAYSTAHISWWGLTDAYSWISAFYGERSFPLLFDRQNRHKPAFDAVLRALSADARSAAVSPADMQAVYEKVATPFKVGVILEPEPGKMLDNPNVFRFGDRWWMLYIQFDRKGYETHLAESTDLVHWTKRGCVFSRGEAGTWDVAQADGGPSLMDVRWDGPNSLGRFDGRYWMTYIGGAREGYETDPLSIGIACAATPTNVWSRARKTAALATTDADVRPFEGRTLYKSFVVDDPVRTLGARFVMYYNAKHAKPPQFESIGMAVSDDMVNWRRFGDGPVVSNGVPGKGFAISGDPMIRKIGDLWVMFYFGCGWKAGVKGAFDTFAVSRDLVNWTKWEGAPLLVPSEPWDAQHAHKPWVIRHDGVTYHFYCAVGSKGRVLALATSKPPEGKEGSR